MPADKNNLRMQATIAGSQLQYKIPYLSLSLEREYSVPHEESRKIAAKRDVMSNHHNTLGRANWPPKTSSLTRMNGACRNTARKL